MVSALVPFALLGDFLTVSALQNFSSAMSVVWIVWTCAVLHLSCLELPKARPDLLDILAAILRASATAMECKLCTCSRRPFMSFVITNRGRESIIPTCSTSL